MHANTMSIKLLHLMQGASFGSGSNVWNYQQFEYILTTSLIRMNTCVDTHLFLKNTYCAIKCDD